MCPCKARSNSSGAVRTRPCASPASRLASLSRADQLVEVQNRLVSELLDVSCLSVSKLDVQFEPHDLLLLVLQRAQRLASVASIDQMQVVVEGEEKKLPCSGK